MKNLVYIMKRILMMIPTLIVVTILIFAMIRAVPGDPADIILGDKATEATKEAWREKKGYNKPIVEQYFIYMGDLLHGDLGKSVKYNRDVVDLMGPRVLVTMSLIVAESTFILGMSFPLGYLAAKHRNGIADRAITMFSLFGISTPGFWVGTLLLLLFALKLGWLPVGNWGEGFFGHVKALILPGFTASLGIAGVMIKTLRSNVIDVIRSNYVDFARSKGIPEKRVKNRHILRNALITTITLFSIRLAFMFGGSIIIETVFSLPGVGYMMVNSIFSRDYAVVQSVMLVFALIVLVVNLVTDAIYSVLDPRVVLE